ncbi:MAG: PHB depolymerase family esterase, partial [Planctomycetota bacterium]
MIVARTLAIAFAAGSVVTAQTLPGVLRFDDSDRDYLIHLPSGWDGVSEVPLLVGLHGGGGSNETFAGPNRFLSAADREGFVAVFPNAVDGVWNDGRDIYPPEIASIDDVGFVAALIDQIAASLPIDADRIYATGMSNGGMLTHRLALEMSYTPDGNRLAGFAPIVANLPLDLLPTEPSLPMHGLLTVGTLDPLMPFEGGQVNQTRGAVLSSNNTRDVWRHRLGLNEATATEIDF